MPIPKVNETTVNIELHDPAVEARLRGKKVTFIFSGKDDAEKFWIAISEAARLQLKLSLTLIRLEKQ